MTWTLLASTSMAPGGSSGGTTSSINTTGANLLVAVVNEDAGAGGYPGAFSDNKGNTWTKIGPFVNGSNGTFLYYVLGPTVGSGHTFSDTGPFMSAGVLAFSGSAGSGTADQTNDAISSGGVTSQPAGSITPSANNSLVIAALGTDAGTSQSISIGTIAENEPFDFGVNVGAAIAYDVQATAGPINPDWTWIGAANAAAIVASFLPASGTSITADALAPVEALSSSEMG